ncbi:MAG: ECF-type sigma factor, partial [Acidobacteriota bacterium]
MKSDPSHQITLLLNKWDEDGTADELMNVVYGELRRMARGYIRRQPGGNSFQTTDLIHETYIKLVRNEDQNWQNRAHF